MNKFSQIIRFSFTAIALVIGCASINAQDVSEKDQAGEVGIRFMPTFSNIRVMNSTGGTVKGQTTISYGVGGFLAFHFNKNVGVQAEVIYNTINQRFTEEDVDHNIKLQYLNIPLLLSLNTNRFGVFNLNLVAGPQIGISAGSKMDTNPRDSTNSTVPILSVKKGDLGLAYGLGVDFGLNPSHTLRVGVGFRGVYGLVDISDNNKTATTSNYYILDRTFIRTNSLYLGLSALF